MINPEPYSMYKILFINYKNIFLFFIYKIKIPERIREQVAQSHSKTYKNSKEI